MKGAYNEYCYRSCCNNSGAIYRNKSNGKYYCSQCATLINEHSLKDYGYEFCTQVEQTPKKEGAGTGDYKSQIAYSSGFKAGKEEAEKGKEKELKAKWDEAVERCKEKVIYYECAPPCIVDFIENVKSEFNQ
jgi:hypothetical protein